MGAWSKIHQTLWCHCHLLGRGFTRGSEVPDSWGCTHKKPAEMNGTLKETNNCAQATSHLTSWPASLTGQDLGERANKGHRLSRQGAKRILRPAGRRWAAAQAEDTEADGKLTSSAAAGSARLGSEPRTLVCGTICRTCSIGRVLTPSPWAVTTPWGGRLSPWGSEADARPHLGSTLGPHWHPQEPA